MFRIIYQFWHIHNSGYIRLRNPHLSQTAVTSLDYGLRPAIDRIGLMGGLEALHRERASNWTAHSRHGHDRLLELSTYCKVPLWWGFVMSVTTLLLDLARITLGRISHLTRLETRNRAVRGLQHAHQQHWCGAYSSDEDVSTYTIITVIHQLFLNSDSVAFGPLNYCHDESSQCT